MAFKVEIIQVCWQEPGWVRLTSCLHGAFLLSQHCFSLAFRLLLWKHIPLKLPSYWMRPAKPGLLFLCLNSWIKGPSCRILHLFCYSFLGLYIHPTMKGSLDFFGSWPTSFFAMFPEWMLVVHSRHSEIYRRVHPYPRPWWKCWPEQYWAPGHVTSIQEPLWWHHVTVH